MPLITLVAACNAGPGRGDRAAGTDDTAVAPAPRTPVARDAAAVVIEEPGYNMGTGVALADFDRDGVVEVFVTGHGEDLHGLLVHQPLDDPGARIVYMASPPVYDGRHKFLHFGDARPGLLVLAGADGTARAFHDGIDATLDGDTVFTDPNVPLVNSNFGYPAAITDDLDDDGVDEIFVGYFSTGPYCNTRAFSSSLVGDHTVDSAWATIWGGPSPGHCAAGELVDTPGDVDGDGRADLALSGGKVDYDGKVFVFYDLPPGDSYADDADAIISGEPEDNAVQFDGIGDLDGDGLTDVVIGASQGQSPFPVYGNGRARVYTGAPRGALGLQDAYATLLGEAFGDAFGRTVAGPGDTDGDGHDDVLVGGIGIAQDGGFVYVVHGPFSGTVEMTDNPAVFRLEGGPNGQIGHGLATWGDLDGDGTDDFAAAVLDSANERGGAYIFLGPW